MKIYWLQWWVCYSSLGNGQLVFKFLVVKKKNQFHSSPSPPSPLEDKSGSLTLPALESLEFAFIHQVWLVKVAVVLLRDSVNIRHFRRTLISCAEGRTLEIVATFQCLLFAMCFRCSLPHSTGVSGAQGNVSGNACAAIQIKQVHWRNSCCLSYRLSQILKQPRFWYLCQTSTVWVEKLQCNI